jgi:hypothetical protein
MAVKTTTGSTSSKPVSKGFEEWLGEHQDSILRHWLNGQPEGNQPVPIMGDIPPGFNLHSSLLRALVDSTVEKRLLDQVLFRPAGAKTAVDKSELSVTAWIDLLQGMRASIIAELHATTQPDHSFELLLAAEEAFSRLSSNLSHMLQQHIDHLAGERDQYQSLYTVTYEIATNLDLDRVAQNALDGALRITGAQTGLVLILNGKRTSYRPTAYPTAGHKAGAMNRYRPFPTWLPCLKRPGKQPLRCHQACWL